MIGSMGTNETVEEEQIQISSVLGGVVLRTT